MIRIGKPYVTQTATGVRLNADISLEEDGSTVRRTLWAEVDAAYADYLTVDRADAFLLGFINYAMRTGQDIRCEAPVTDRLYEQVVEQFLPWYYRSCATLRASKRPRPMKVMAERIPGVGAGPAVGAGVSCGVDSLHVFASKTDITHGVVWNMHPMNYLSTPEERRVGWESLRSKAEAFTQEIGKPLVAIDTNYDTALFRDFWSDTQFSWANLFALFTVQRLFRKYYLASSESIENFRLAISPGDHTSFYDAMLMPCASTAGLSIQVIGAELSRLDKVRVLADYQPAWHHLNVCWGHGRNNCTSQCPKCIRTVLELDAIGALERFSGVFDVEDYHRHRNLFLREILLQRKANLDMRELSRIFSRELTVGLAVEAWAMRFGERVIHFCKTGRI